MTTHHHDPETIAAVAEGRITDAATIAEIASCAECASELAAQEAALAALRNFPSYTLSELESARIRRAVRSELGVVDTVEFEPTSRRSRVPLAALGTAAAVLAAVVVAGPALNLIGGGASDSGDTEASITAESAADTLRDTRQTDDDMSFDLPESASQGVTQSPGITTTTSAADGGSGMDGLDRYAYFRDEATETLRLMAMEGEYDEDELKRAALSVAGESVVDQEVADAALCITVTLTNEPNFVDGFQVARGNVSGREVVYVVYLAETLEESVVVAHAADNCEVLGRSDS